MVSTSRGTLFPRRQGINRSRGRNRRGGLRRSDVVGRAPGCRLTERYPTDEHLPEYLRPQASMHDRDVGMTENGTEGPEQEYDGAEEFVWEPIGDWRGVQETFVRENFGPTRAFNNAYDAFRAYWDDSILSHIALETNRYAQDIHAEIFTRWYNTNLDEILILFAFWMMLGIIMMPTIKA